jgi:hypothetical protein
MNLNELISTTSGRHQEFKLLMEEDLEKKLQQFALKNEGLTQYEACSKLLEIIFTDSVGSLVETWLNKD